jgi:hypothetical protein
MIELSGSTTQCNDRGSPLLASDAGKEIHYYLESMPET